MKLRHIPTMIVSAFLVGGFVAISLVYVVVSIVFESWG